MKSAANCDNFRDDLRPSFSAVSRGTFASLHYDERAQGPPFGPVNPMLHVQLLADTLPRGDDELDGQAMQLLT